MTLGHFENWLRSVSQVAGAILKSASKTLKSDFGAFSKVFIGSQNIV